MWNYSTPGITDNLFEQLPGIPMSTRELRVLLISALRMKKDSILWDIGAGTGTIPIEIGLLCPESQIIAIERDEEIVGLIKRNCQKFGVNNIKIIEGSAPECLTKISPLPDRVCIEGCKEIKPLLKSVWNYLKPDGRVVATANNLETVYLLSESFAELQAINIEVVQSAINRLETRGIKQVFSAVDPIFIFSADKPH